MTETNFAPLWHFINERHAIYLRKTLLEGHLPKADYDPLRAAVDNKRWSLDHLTDDPILGTYRFCNVFRELDRVTIWIDEHIRKPFADHEHLWFMLAIARTINWPPTLENLLGDTAVYNCWPKQQFTPEQLGKMLDHYKARGDKIYTGAYMIRAESNPKAHWYSWTKQRYIAEIVLGRLWEDRGFWRNNLEGGEVRDGIAGTVSMQQVWKWFQIDRYIGWGPFMAGQVTTDLRHTRYLQNAPDAETWAALGPGSLRGLNRLHGRPVAYKLSQEAALIEMRQLQEMAYHNVRSHVPKAIDLTDIQNCLCETDKYLRVQLKQGEPRTRYVRGRGY